MSQQGERRTDAEDDWWDRLYDEAAPDTGPAPTGHTVDDHFDSTPGAPAVLSTAEPEPPRPLSKEPRARGPWEPPLDPPERPPTAASGRAAPDPRSAAVAERGWDAWLPGPRRGQRADADPVSGTDPAPPAPEPPTPAEDPLAPAPRPTDTGTPATTGTGVAATTGPGAATPAMTGPEAGTPGARDSAGPTGSRRPETPPRKPADTPSAPPVPPAPPGEPPRPALPPDPPLRAAPPRPGAPADAPPGRDPADVPPPREDTAAAPPPDRGTAPPPPAPDGWGPPSPLPGAPGQRQNLRRTRRLWDEPSPDAYGRRPGTPTGPDPDPDPGPAAPAADAPGPDRAQDPPADAPVDPRHPAPARLRDVPPLPTSFPPRRDDPQHPAGVFGPPPPAAPGPTRPAVTHLGDGPPTYDAEPTALAAADPQDLGALVPDTVLDGARYGSYTLRAASVRGDSARFRGEPRRDALLTARFGSGDGALVLVAVASGARAAEGAHLAAAEACRWIAGAVGRSHARLAEDIRAARRGDLKSGLHRLTDRSYGKLRARAAELGLEPGEYTADLRCLLLSADPLCRTRIYFGVGEGGLLRLRDGAWQDIEPPEPAPEALTGEPVVGFGSVPRNGSEPEAGPDGDRLTMDLGIPTPPSPYVDTAPPSSRFRFRASVARADDVLLLCSAGLAEPLRGEAALAGELAERWGEGRPPGLAAYLADVQLRVKGYADDRTAVAVWED
ncbi:protein phosphatase 2C domain-containing protein [Streptomyces sp. NPDC088745]|uniref:protein phosphatase 2C domain-containing protein n=1 Tax=Streptomyces sp. NPDC088745 TaxID=3365884 RepID=UPI0038267655